MFFYHAIPLPRKYNLNAEQYGTLNDRLEELGDDAGGGAPDRSGRRVVRRRDDDPPAPDESLVPTASRGSQCIEGHLEEVGGLCRVRDDPGTAVRGRGAH